jgi:hypothetical protein
MKSIRTYLIVVGVLLVLAVVAGIVVWYLYQNLDGAQPHVMPQELTEPSSDGVPAEEGNVDETYSETAVSHTIDTDTLSPGQREALSTFGIEGEVTITEAQIACAEEAIGVVRLNEITNGSAPSPLEAMKLLPCFKK